MCKGSCGDDLAHHGPRRVPIMGKRRYAERLIELGRGKQNSRLDLTRVENGVSVAELGGFLFDRGNCRSSLSISPETELRIASYGARDRTHESEIISNGEPFSSVGKLHCCGVLTDQDARISIGLEVPRDRQGIIGALDEMFTCAKQPETVTNIPFRRASHIELGHGESQACCF